MNAPRKEAKRGARAIGPREWLRRIGWMLVLWAGGVVTLSIMAFLIRVIMHAAGMR
ncbi:DUF2474 domain-containing protein [Massilia niastensis]|uniref:DUF2474 domain-containing protein n=1 Tax=Massilia niastensis TaxID=544911 RepID=UPI00035C68E0|nr:DUF2474 domain-containing protein [Massilia niastensis]